MHTTTTAFPVSLRNLDQPQVVVEAANTTASSAGDVQEEQQLLREEQSQEAAYIGIQHWQKSIQMGRRRQLLLQRKAARRDAKVS